MVSTHSLFGISADAINGSLVQRKDRSRLDVVILVVRVEDLRGTLASAYSSQERYDGVSTYHVVVAFEISCHVLPERLKAGSFDGCAFVATEVPRSDDGVGSFAGDVVDGVGEVLGVVVGEWIGEGDRDLDRRVSMAAFR